MPSELSHRCSHLFTGQGQDCVPTTVHQIVCTVDPSRDQWFVILVNSHYQYVDIPTIFSVTLIFLQYCYI